jgi:hypothetical protein
MSVGTTLVPATWLNRRDGQKSRGVGDFEIRQHGAGEARELAMTAERPLGFAGRPTSVKERRDVVRSGEIPRGGAPDGLYSREQINAIFRPAQREDLTQPYRSRRQLAAALEKGFGVDHQDLGFAVFDLVDLILQRGQRMQRGSRQPGDLRRDGSAPGVGPIGAEQGHAGGRTRAGVHQDSLHASDPFARSSIGDRSARPTERRPRGVARESPKRLCARSRQ